MRFYLLIIINDVKEMSNWEVLAESAGFIAGGFAMNLFVEEIRRRVKKTVGPLSATQKAEKELVEARDKMFVAYKAETQQREMTEDAKKIARQQNEFYHKYGVSADSWRLVRSLSLLGKSASLRTGKGNTQKGE